MKAEPKGFPDGLDMGCESEESRGSQGFMFEELNKEEWGTLQREQAWDGEFSTLLLGILHLRNLLDIQL